MRKSGGNAIVNETREVFSARHQLSVSEFGNVNVDVAVIEAGLHFVGENPVELTEIDVIKTHNPFAVNDLWFARETGADVDAMNPFGSSLIYGHPQAPTGARGLIELIWALHDRGGGRGLFTGCVAGDTGAALVIELDG